MFGASLLKSAKYAMHIASGEAAMMTGSQVTVLVIGMAVAFIVSIAAIKFLMSYVKKRNFKPFGYYRVVLGAVLLVYYFVFR